MPELFLYDSLKAKGALDSALGVNHPPPPTRKARVRDFREVFMPGRGKWPTLTPYWGWETKGEIVQLSPEELKRMDAWGKGTYSRQTLIVRDENGDLPVWAYIYEPTQEIRQ